GPSRRTRPSNAASSRRKTKRSSNWPSVRPPSRTRATASSIMSVSARSCEPSPTVSIARRAAGASVIFPKCGGSADEFRDRLRVVEQVLRTAVEVRQLCLRVHAEDVVDRRNDLLEGDAAAPGPLRPRVGLADDLAHAQAAAVQHPAPA